MFCITIDKKAKNTYKEVKYAETKELKYKAHMTKIIEPAEHFATQAEMINMNMNICYFFQKLEKQNKECTLWMTFSKNQPLRSPQIQLLMSLFSKT